jgi:hypothetical protein
MVYEYLLTYTAPTQFEEQSFLLLTKCKMDTVSRILIQCSLCFEIQLTLSHCEELFS